MMNTEKLLNFPSTYSHISCKRDNDKVKLNCQNISTGWIDTDDMFFKRIQYVNLNHDRLTEHLIYEIRMKNILDEGINYLEHEKYEKAIECFDKVIYYDSDYSEALINKSYGLYAQKHYVKALRYYKKAVKSGFVQDEKYHRKLLDNSENEINSFSQLKANIYRGDEYFAEADYENALNSYSKALATPSKFKQKILYKLLNKKATALFYLGEFINAVKCFDESLKNHDNDYANFAKAYTLYKLSQANVKNQVCESCLDRIYVKNIMGCLKKAVKINKKQLLIKADISYALGCIDDAVKYYTEFLDCHFIRDFDYMKASEALCIINSM